MTDELIPGATGSTYVLQPEDVGRYIYCRVRATNVAGTAFVDAAPVGAIAPIVAPDVTAPTITSAATASNAENSVLVHPLTANETVSWSIVGGADAARFEIVGNTLRWLGNGTKDFEAPNDADSDNIYVVQVRATDNAGNSTDQTVSVTVTDVVEAGPGVPPSLVTAPSITDTPAEGVPLSVDPGEWDGDPTIVFNYEWHRTDAAVGIPPTLAEAPSITTEPPSEGVELTCAPGTWDGDPTITFSYEWHKVTGGATGAAGSPIGLLLALTKS